ncbi:MAG: hypothetical protein V7788_00860 [Alphaproteobacteria bacterium]|jgi:hypothetical protein
MVVFPLSLIYILCALGVGYIGRNAWIGWIGVSLLAFIFTPLLVLIVVLLLRTVNRTPAAPAA